MKRVGKADLRQGRGGGHRRIPQKIAGKSQVFAGAQGGFQGLPMAHVMKAFSKRPFARIVQPDRARGGSQPPAENLQKGGLAGAVASQHHQRIARPEGERYALEDAALSSFANQIFDAQTQPPDPCRDSTPEWF